MDPMDVEQIVEEMIRDALESLEVELRFIEEDVKSKTKPALQVQIIRNDLQYGGRCVLHSQRARIPSSLLQQKEKNEELHHPRDR